MHVALALSVSNKHNQFLLCHLFMTLQNSPLTLVSDLYLGFFKCYNNHRRINSCIIVSNVFVAS